MGSWGFWHENCSLAKWKQAKYWQRLGVKQSWIGEELHWGQHLAGKLLKEVEDLQKMTQNPSVSKIVILL